VNDAARVETESDAGPGPLLRAAREAGGLTEQQAAELLNLDVTVVAALERDDFGALGAPVFAKGHLRRYGAMLRVPEDQLLAAYEHARVQPAAPTLVPKSRQEMMPVRGRSKWPWVLGGAVLFVIAAGVAAYLAEYGFGWPSGSGGESVTLPQDTARPGEAPPREADGAASAAPSGEPGAVAPTDATGEAAATLAAPLLPVPPGHVSLTIAFAADSWTEIYDGSGQPVLYDLGRAGSQRTIAAAAPLSVTFGNAPAVTLHVGGRPVTLPAPPAGGTVSRFKIEADGTLR
jgi:cytoskeleton protein RodZ